MLFDIREVDRVILFVVLVHVFGTTPQVLVLLLCCMNLAADAFLLELRENSLTLKSDRLL